MTGRGGLTDTLSSMCENKSARRVECLSLSPQQIMETSTRRATGKPAACEHHGVMKAVNDEHACQGATSALRYFGPGRRSLHNRP